MNIVRRGRSEYKSIENVLDFAVAKCQENLKNKEVRDALVLLYSDKRYERRREAFGLLSVMAERYRDIDAMSALGERYLNGPESGESLAWAKAIPWFQSAQNFRSLGLALLKSHNPSDLQKARDAFQKGVETGDLACQEYLDDEPN